MSNLAWLFVAFAAVWVAIGGYLLSIVRRQARIERELDALSRSQDPGGGQSTLPTSSNH